MGTSIGKPTSNMILRRSDDTPHKSILATILVQTRPTPTVLKEAATTEYAVNGLIYKSRWLGTVLRVVLLHQLRQHHHRAIQGTPPAKLSQSSTSSGSQVRMESVWKVLQVSCNNK